MPASAPKPHRKLRKAGHGRAQSEARRGRRKSRAEPFTAETEPFRRDWLLLTPGQRLLRSWRMRRLLRDPQGAHDAQSLPRL